MSRYRKPYRFKKIGKYYYYKLSNQKSFHTTGEKSKTLAEQFVTLLMKKEESSTDKTLKEYAEDFYIWDKCPHIRRLREENKSIGQRHARLQRRVLEKHIFSDPIADKKMNEIKRGDILDFRTKLINNNIGMNTINKVMGVLKVIFNEALYREEVNRNPIMGVGNMKHTPKEVGTFTEEELRGIFSENKFYPWQSILDYTCFLIAATTGMRRGEILALRWRDINFQKGYLTVNQAWKDRNELGKPKWGKVRFVPIPKFTLEKLIKLRSESFNNEEDDFVFAYDDGGRLGGTWWRKRFIAAMKKAKINFEERNLRPHSFRHSLNSILKAKNYDTEKFRLSFGWADQKIQNNYTHVNIEYLMEQANIVSDIFLGKNYE